MDYHRNSGNTVAAWLFRSEHKSKLPANRQLDPYFDRYRRLTRRFKPVGDRLIRASLKIEGAINK